MKVIRPGKWVYEWVAFGILKIYPLRVENVVRAGGQQLLCSKTNHLQKRTRKNKDRALKMLRWVCYPICILSFEFEFQIFISRELILDMYERFRQCVWGVRGTVDCWASIGCTTPYVIVSHKRQMNVDYNLRWTAAKMFTCPFPGCNKPFETIPGIRKHWTSLSGHFGECPKLVKSEFLLCDTTEHSIENSPCPDDNALIEMMGLSEGNVDTRSAGRFARASGLGGHQAGAPTY
jgi:hypothetical protein